MARVVRFVAPLELTKLPSTQDRSIDVSSLASPGRNKRMLAKGCIYCKVALTSATRIAHVWQAALGGRICSREICCDTCNNALGPVEETLRSSLRHLFASVGATNDRGAPFEVMIEYEGRDFALAGGNAILQAGRERFDAATKSVVVPLPAGFTNQVERLSTMVINQKRGPEFARALKLEPGDPPPFLPTGPTRNEHDLKFGAALEHKRVFVKVALELLAYHRHDLAIRGELSEARRFARHGAGTFRGRPDARSKGSGLLDGAAMPEIFNAIEVWSYGCAVFFRVTFLGPIVFTGTLTTEWGGERFRAAYAFDARHPRSLLAQTFEEGDGPNLAVWVPEMVGEVVDDMLPALEAISLRLAQSATIPARDPTPDIEQLREAVAQRVEAKRK